MAASEITSARSGSKLSNFLLVKAAECLMIPKALINGDGIFSAPIGKLIRLRAVCAP